jgi:uncharacterized protein
MAEHQNAALIRAGYEAFAAGDLATVSELFAENIAWHSPGRSALAGDVQGKDAVLARFGTLAELTQGTFRQEIHDIVANDEHVVVMVRSSWAQPHPYEGPGVHVWHVSGGKATEAWVLDVDAVAADAALTP